jgi:hypothetical protein
MESTMKLFNLVLCGSLILSPIGCASQRESVMSRPVPVETSVNGEATEIQIVSGADERPHPIRDGLKGAANVAGNFLAAPLIFPVLIIAYAVGGMPKC